MKTIPLLVSFSESFDYTEGQTRYNERLAYEILKHAAAMSDEGYEITFDDLEESWEVQNTTLAQQASLLSALSAEGNLSDAWSARLSSLASLIPSIMAMAVSPAGFSLKAAVSSVIESAISSASGMVKQQVGGDEELHEILKTAFLKESLPGSEIYDQTLLQSAQKILQAVQDLKYNDEILELPTTPRPIKVALRGKTIQQ